MFILTTMKTYTTILKILILSSLVSGCAYFTAPKYDTNELLLMAQFRAEVQELAPQCGKSTIEMTQAKKSFRVLQAYTKNGPSNEDYVKMLQTVEQLIKDLDSRNGSMSKVYCDLKVRNIETSIKIINEASARKH